MYVRVGQGYHGIPENLCLSLLTKEGLSDLEASDGLERDAMVNSFSFSFSVG